MEAIKHIMIAGPMYSGKSTIARAMKEQGYMWVRFGDLLKLYASDMLSAVGIHASVDHINEAKKLYRPFLQELGEVIGFNDDPKFVHEALGDWEINGRPPAIFDNPRTEAQAKVLDYFGFKLVQLELDPSEQYKRALKYGVTLEELIKVRNHPVEQGIGRPDLVELYLDAAKPTEELVQVLLGQREVEAA